MGADLITAALWMRAETKLNFDAGVEAAKALAGEELDEFADRCCGFFDDDLFDDSSAVAPEQQQKVRERAVAWVEELRWHADPANHSRTLASWRSPDGVYEIWVTGGATWGDSPDEPYDAMANLGDCNSVLEAIGFMPWPKQPYLITEPGGTVLARFADEQARDEALLTGQYPDDSAPAFQN